MDTVVKHRFPILVPCPDCGARGVRPGLLRSVVCGRCDGESLITLTVTPEERTLLAEGGHVEEDQGRYTIHPKRDESGS